MGHHNMMKTQACKKLKADKNTKRYGKIRTKISGLCALGFAFAMLAAAVICPGVISLAADNKVDSTSDSKIDSKAAAETDSSAGTEGEGSDSETTITVLLADKGKVLADTDVSLYMIAAFDDSEKRTVTAEKGYKSLVSELDLSSAEKACTYESTQTAKVYIEENKLKPIKTVKTDSDGKAAFGVQEEGIYLAEFGENALYEVDAFILEAPLCINGKWYNDVTASPKISPTEPTTEPTTEPNTEPTTEPGGGKEKLPQTGQMKWPIPVLVIGGVTFIVLGYVQRGREKKDED